MFQDVSEDYKWYLIQCKPQQSFRAEEHLTNQGFHCFHPTHIVKKKKTIQGVPTITATRVPLFPYYLFIHLSHFESWYTIRSTRGVKNMVMFGQTPGYIEDTLIQSLKFHCDTLNGLEPPPLYKAGDKVRITEGCFKDLEGIVTATSGDERVILLLNLFNREQKLAFSPTSLAVSA